MYRLNQLVKLDHQLYHTQDLAMVWGISNKNTLYTTIKRYVQKGILVPVYKGLYSTVPLNLLNPLQLGKSINHNYCYLTTETVLSQSGIISPAVYPYTFASAHSQQIIAGTWQFRFRQLKPEYLYHPAGITDENGILISSIERAVADMLYFNPKYHFDNRHLIDFEIVKSLQKEIGYI